jgi:outer membrane protein assembly factor BamB
VWTYQTSAAVPLSPTISADGGLVYASSQSDYPTPAQLYALNATTGEIVSSFQSNPNPGITSPPDGFSAATLSDDGKELFVGCADSHLYSLDANNLAVNWAGNTSQDQYGGSLEATPSLSIDGQTVMIGGDTGVLWALNSTTGENLWNFKTCAQYYCADQILGTAVPSPDGQSVYVTTTGGNLYKLSIGLGPVRN